MRRAAVFAFLFAAACASKQEAGFAAATVAAAVAVAAINRAATAECWGSCGPGYVCDSASRGAASGAASGVCVPIDELEADPEYDPELDDDGCIEEEDGRILCPDDPETFVSDPLMSEPEPSESVAPSE